MVLAAAARDADLLVLGSVAETCVRKAVCPVVVIPVPADPAQMTLRPHFIARRAFVRAKVPACVTRRAMSRRRYRWTGTWS